MTEHSAEILVGSWPSQLVMTWSGYAMACTEEATRLSHDVTTELTALAVAWRPVCA